MGSAPRRRLGVLAGGGDGSMSQGSAAILACRGRRRHEAGERNLARSGATACRLIGLAVKVVGSAARSIGRKAVVAEAFSVLLEVAGRAVLLSTPGRR